MSKVLVTEDYLEDIADAIRGKLSSSDTYTPGQMAGAIGSIPSGGGGGGATILSGVSTPSSAVGGNGDLYLQYFSSEELPSGYAALDYVGFGNNQYFDTGISCNTQSLRVVADVAITAINTEALWGGRWSESGYFFMIYNGIFRWHSGGKAVDAINVSTNTWYKIETTKAGITIDGVYYALTSPSGTDSGDDLQFGTVANAQGARASMQLGRVKIYSGDTLLADYVPALDGSNVACMYDLVGQTAKYSAANAFTASPSPLSDGEIEAAYVKVNGAWETLIGANIDDVGGVTA